MPSIAQATGFPEVSRPRKTVMSFVIRAMSPASVSASLPGWPGPAMDSMSAKSPPAQNELRLADARTTPFIASSDLIRSTIAVNSQIVSALSVLTFFPAISKVTSATPSPSTSTRQWFILSALFRRCDRQTR